MNPLYFLFLAGYFIIRLYNFPYVLRRAVVANDTPFGDRLLSTAIYLGIVGVPLLTLFYPAAFAEYIVAPELLYPGILACSCSLVILALAHKALFSNYAGNLVIYGNHRLVTDGIYKYFKHPIYVAVGLFVIGAFFFTGSVLLIVAWFAYAILVFRRVPREELMLEDAFGAAYVAYRSSTLL